jgi:hypothetical protein
LTCGKLALARKSVAKYRRAPCTNSRGSWSCDEISAADTQPTNAARRQRSFARLYNIFGPVDTRHGIRRIACRIDAVPPAHGYRRAR